MKIRWRLVIALAIAGLLPLLPLMWTVRTAVGTGASALAPQETGAALRVGLDMARAALQRQQAETEARLELIRKIASAPPADTKPLPQGALKEGESLFCSLLGKWHVYDNGAWYPSDPPEVQSTDEFDEIPREVVAEATDFGTVWRLISPYDRAFLERASQLQRAAADWAVRSLERNRLISSLVGTYLITYLLAMLLAIGAGLSVVVPATRAIEELTRVAEAVREGDEDRRAYITSYGEIGKLATTFNLMLNRLDESRRKAAEMEKMAAWRELARVLAHEIKNPLTPIQLSVQQLSDSYRGEDDKFGSMLATTREIVDEEIESLRQLTREFSEFARAPQLTPADMTPSSLLKDLASLYGDRLQAVSNEAEFTVFWDREKLKRALINLLDNGLAAAGVDGTMRLTYLHENQCSTFVVEDSGPGVPADQVSKIFEPYFTTKRTGVGLGLPIVRTTCEQHGGSIALDRSEELGGARFTIRVPDRATVPSPDQG